MSARIRCVEYVYTTVPDMPGMGCAVLSELAASGVSLMAFSSVPMGTENTQLVLFPEQMESLARAAERGAFTLSAPQRAFMIQADDRLGALFSIHQKLADARINVYASSGVTDGKGSFGYVLYVRAADYDEAARILDAEPLST